MRQVLVPSRSQLEYDEFQAAVAESRLCRPEDWPADIELAAILIKFNELIQLHSSSSDLSVDQAIHGLTLNAALQNAPHVVSSVRWLPPITIVKGHLLQALTLLLRLPSRWRGILNRALIVCSIIRNVRNFDCGALTPTGRTHDNYNGRRWISSWVDASSNRAIWDRH